MPFDDFYSVLGLKHTATGDEIRTAYRKLVLECHPDRHPNDPAAEERFKKLALAYGTLSSDSERQRYDLKYDAYHEAQRRQAQPPIEAPPQTPVARPRREPPADKLLEENGFRQEDTLRGLYTAVAACLMAQWYLAPGSLIELRWAPALLAVPCIGGWLGKLIRHTQGLPPLYRDGWGDEAVNVSPLILSGAALIIWHLAATQAALPFVFRGSLSAAAGGAFGCTIGSGFGRAFWQPAHSAGTKLIALVAAGGIAAISGGFIPLTLALFSGNPFALSNYDGLFAATIGASLGALVASLPGTWYKT